MIGKPTILKLLSDYHMEFRRQNVDNDTQASGSEYYQIILQTYNACLSLLNDRLLCDKLGINYDSVLEEARRLGPVISAVKLPVPSIEELNQLGLLQDKNSGFHK